MHTQLLITMKQIVKELLKTDYEHSKYKIDYSISKNIQT